MKTSTVLALVVFCFLSLAGCRGSVEVTPPPPPPPLTN